MVYDVYVCNLDVYKTFQMARVWMYTADRRSKEYMDGVQEFLRAADAMKRSFISCPCVDCKNVKQYSSTRTIYLHLLTRGFKTGYTCWTEHGEEGIMEDDADEEEEDWNNVVLDGAVQFAGPAADVPDEPTADVSDEPAEETDLDQMLHDGGRDLTDERDIKKFEQLKVDARTPLYEGCKAGDSRLHSTLTLLQFKARHGLSDTGFDDILSTLKNLLPENNTLPESTYEAKKVVCPLGLEVQKIHACPNDCILYRNEYENLEACPVCKASRYKLRRDDPGEVEGERKRKKRPAKVLWYFPVIPRLKRCLPTKIMPG